MSSIIKENNGKYTLKYSYKDVLTGKLVRTTKRGFATKKEAIDYDKKLSHYRSDILFSTLFEESQKTKEALKNTLLENERLIDNHIPFIKDMAYSKITKPYLMALRSRISELNLSSITKNKILRIIKSTCAYANDVYDLPNNSTVMKSFATSKKKEMSIWELEQYQIFEKTLKDYRPEFVPFFHTLYFTGLRKGEAKALLTDDYDPINSTLNISKAMRRDISSLKSPKNIPSIRKVQLDKITNDLLKPLKSNEKWLFGDYKPLSSTTIDRVFSQTIKLAGLPKIRIHDLRHSHCSYLIGNGADIVAIASRLGHSSVNTTLNTYSHVIDKSQQKILDILEIGQDVVKK